MAWVKLDDSMPTHPKVMASGVDGYALDVAGISYCNRYSTDGFIAFHVIGAVLPMLRNPQKVAAKLVEVGRWSQVEGGWLIHDYHDYQPTAEHLREVSEKRAEAGRKGGQQPKGKQNASRVEANEEQVASDVRKPVPSRPVLEPLPSVEVARRRDLLWDATCEFWGTPATDTERGRRNKELSELRKAGVTPDELRYLVEKAVVRWKGEARPGLAGIVRNLGDLRAGFDVSRDQVDKFTEEQRREARRREAAAMDQAKGLPG